MLITHIMVGVITGGIAGFLVQQWIPQIDLALPEGIMVGVIGALAGVWLLSVLQAASGGDLIYSLATAALGAGALLLLFVAAKSGWSWLPGWRKKAAWSLVEPFEE